MKKNIVILVMLFVCALSAAVSAQDNGNARGKKPKWVSDEGYWQIITHVKTPKTSLVQFYNNRNELIYSEKLEGVRLNLKRRQTCMRLKEALELALVDFERKQLLRNEQLVKNIFRSSK